MPNFYGPPLSVYSADDLDAVVEAWEAGQLSPGARAELDEELARRRDATEDLGFGDD